MSLATESYPHNYLRIRPLRPLIKDKDSYCHGIEKLREHFPGVFPYTVKRYIDPFLGDGSMYLNMKCDDMSVNDYSLELINLYQSVRERDKEFFACLTKLSDMWSYLEDLADGFGVSRYRKEDYDALSGRLSFYGHELEEMNFTDQRETLLVPGLRMTTIAWLRRFRRLEYEQVQAGVTIEDRDRRAYVECAHKAGLYDHVRAVYSDLKELNPVKTACWYFLKRYCFEGIYRRDAKGNFTSPYGGLCMNSHLPDIEIDNWSHPDLTRHLKATDFDNRDYLEFLGGEEVDDEDFLFLSPPKVSREGAFVEFSFGLKDHEELANYLLHECKGQWVVVMDADRRVEKFYGKKYGKANIMYFSPNFDSREVIRSDDCKVVIVKNF